MHWSHPLLLWGLAATVVPVLLHLVLRARPRRVRFPALVLLGPALLAGQRARRVRNWLLLLVRCGVVACAAVLLAGPTCRSTTGTGRDGPVAGVLVLDDSISLSRRRSYQESTTLLDLARQQALAVADEFDAWPSGSRIAVVTAGRARGEWSERATYAARALRAARGMPPHAQPLGAALQETARLLRSAAPLRPQVWVFTDGAASAWRDVRPGIFGGSEAIDVRVFAAGAATPQNVGLRACTTAAQVQPAGLPVPLQARVAAVGATVECRLTVRGSDDGAMLEAAPFMVEAGEEKTVVLVLPPLPAGVHGISIELAPADMFDADQARYLALQTGPRPRVWLITAAPPGLEHPSALILRNALAPEVLAADEQRIELRMFAGPSALPEVEAALQADEEPPALIVLLTGVGGEAGARHALRRAVERGTMLLLVPDASPQPDWPEIRELIAEARPRVDAVDSVFAGGAQLIAPLTAELFAEWSRCHVAQILRFDDVLPGVQVAAQLASGEPALYVRPLGDGAVWLLAVSPDPRASELGTRAGGLLTWLHALAASGRGPPASTANWSVGEERMWAFPVLRSARQVVLRGPGTGGTGAGWLHIDDGIPRTPWPTNLPGLYQAAADAEQGRIMYAVNWPSEELDLTPIDAEGVEQHLGVPVDLAESAGGAGRVKAAWWWGRVSGILGLLLVLLLTGELVLAARADSAGAASEIR